MSKTIKNVKEISKRTIVIVALLVMLVFSLISLSFAWYRNYIDIVGMDVTTGKISFELQTYHVHGDNTVSGPETQPFDGETRNSVVLESQVTKVETWANMPHHVYYFIKNTATDTAIDLDASLSLSLDNATIPDEIGAIQVSITNVKQGEIAQDLAGVSDDQIKQKIQEVATNGINIDSNKIAFSNLETAYREFFVKKGEYVCYRLTYEVPANLASLENMELGIRVSFCLAQEGGLPGTETATEYVVYSNEGLQATLGKYRPNDKIIVKGNIDYVGDLIFNRPLSLVVQNADFTVQGNLTYAYPYQGHFSIDTSKGGRIIVIKKGVEQTDSAGNVTGMTYVGGNFYINVPKAQMEVLGKNNTAVGRGDIYVQETFTVNTSKSDASSTTDGGFIVNGARIIHTNGIVGDSEELKTVNVGAHTKINVLQYSSLGPIVATDFVIEIENRGTIEQIDLYSVKYDDTYTRFEPQIFIDNYGRLTDVEIRLPINWAVKFGKISENQYTGNTRIVSNPGAGEMKTNTCTCDNGFKSDGSKNPETDHIEYVKLHTFVEKVNDLPTEIVVQYTEDTDLWKIGNGNDTVKIGSNLQTLLEYYSGKIMASNTQGGSGDYVNQALKINDVGSITYMKIVCLNTVLTSTDYTYIRTNMPQLRTLDLSDASSDGLALPVDAFKNMANLTTFIPSQYDTTWRTNNIFMGTGLTELWLPTSLTSVTANAFSGSNVRYIHTSSTIVSGLNPTLNENKVFLFVPDLDSYDHYNASGNNKTYYAGKVFMDATRYATDSADYFLRLNNENFTCELVTVVGRTGTDYKQFDAALEKENSFAFDFATVKVDNVIYDIVSYDAYAFYSRTILGINEITFSDKLEKIDKSAFYNVIGITDLTFNSDVTIYENAFYKMASGVITFTQTPTLEQKAFNESGCTKIVFEKDATVKTEAFLSATAKEIYGQNVIELGTKAFNSMKSLVYADFRSLKRCDVPFSGCTSLVRLEIGVLQNGSVLLNAGNVVYLFVHTTENDEPADYILPKQATPTRVAFLSSTYSKLFEDIGTEIILDEGLSVDDIHEYYNDDDPIMVNGFQVPNFFYTLKADGTVKVLHCPDTQMNTLEEVFFIPKADGTSYVISEIEQYAYVRTNIHISGDLVFPDSVETVGVGAFAYNFSGLGTSGGGTLLSTKYCGRLILSNITSIGMYSFLKWNCYAIIGNHIQTIGGGCFAANPYLVSVELPALRNAIHNTVHSSWGGYFLSCPKLLFLKLGPLDGEVSEWGLWEANSIEFIIRDGTVATPLNDRKWFNFYQNEDTKQPIPAIAYKGSTHAVGSVKPFALENMIICNIVEQSVTIGGTVYTYEIPTSIYSKNADGITARMDRYVPDVFEGDSYRVANGLVDTGVSKTFLGEMIPVYKEVQEDVVGMLQVNKIERFTFHFVSFAHSTFITGKYITEIGESCFSYSGRLKDLVLENVTTISKNAFVKIPQLETVTANRVVTVGDSAFLECSSLRVVSFPLVGTIGSKAFEKTRIVELNLPMATSVGSSAFANNSALVTASFGDKELTLSASVFSNCPALREVVFRSEAMVKGPASNDLFGGTGTTTQPSSLMIIVRESVKDQYTSATPGATWQKIPCDTSEGGICNIDSFELSSYDAERNITFYYSLLEGDKVELSFMRTTETTITGEFVFPSTFTINVEVGEGEEAVTETKTYRVTRIAEGFLQTLKSYSGITKYVLPSELEHFTDNYSIISSNLAILEIADTNTTYSTVDGVLYNKLGTILLYYPKAKSDINFTILETVKMIRESAFAGNYILQHVTVKGDVIFGLKAFEGCAYLESVTFESETPSYFAGKGTFEGCSEVLKIYVPESAIEAYKQNALIDEDLIERIEKATQTP